MSEQQAVTYIVVPPEVQGEEVVQQEPEPEVHAQPQQGTEHVRACA